MKVQWKVSPSLWRLSQHPVYQLSVGQIGVGILAVVIQLIISICNDVHLNLSTIGEGFFCGVVFMTVGCLGVFTYSRVNMFTVRSFMFSNISALIFALLLLVLSSCLLVDILWYQEEDNYAQSGFYILKTLISLQIILSITEIMLSVTCCSLCYKSYCFNTAGPVATHRWEWQLLNKKNKSNPFLGTQSLLSKCYPIYTLFLVLLSLYSLSSYALSLLTQGILWLVKKSIVALSLLLLDCLVFIQWRT